MRKRIIVAVAILLCAFAYIYMLRGYSYTCDKFLCTKCFILKIHQKDSKQYLFPLNKTEYQETPFCRIFPEKKGCNHEWIHVYHSSSSKKFGLNSSIECGSTNQRMLSSFDPGFVAEIKNIAKTDQRNAKTILDCYIECCDNFDPRKELWMEWRASNQKLYDWYILNKEKLFEIK